MTQAHSTVTGAVNENRARRIRQEIEKGESSPNLPEMAPERTMSKSPLKPGGIQPVVNNEPCEVSKSSKDPESLLPANSNSGLSVFPKPRGRVPRGKVWDEKSGKWKEVTGESRAGQGSRKQQPGTRSKSSAQGPAAPAQKRKATGKILFND